MSRTYRRKGKTPDWLYDKHYKYTSSVKKQGFRDYWYYPVIWIPLPKQEWELDIRVDRRYHRDAFNYTRFKPWVKRRWAKRRRQWDRQEFAKFAKYDEYEPIWFQTQIDTWWWD